MADLMYKVSTIKSHLVHEQKESVSRRDISTEKGGPMATFLVEM